MADSWSSWFPGPEAWANQTKRPSADPKPVIAAGVERLAADANELLPENWRGRYSTADALDFVDPTKSGDEGFTERQDYVMDRLGYKGKGWTPDQISELGRDPEPFELSPGGRMASDAAARAKLREALVAPPGMLEGFVGADRRDQAQNAIDTYEDEVGRTHENQWKLNSLNNPDGYLGHFTTQMGPVISDGFGFLGDALLGRGNINEAAGNAAVRAGAADWNRSSPMLANDAGWRANDALIDQQRQALSDSTSMGARDFLRAAANKTGLDYQPGAASAPFEIAAILGNGLLDGSTVGGVGLGTVLGKSAAKNPTLLQHLGRELLEEGITDGGITTATHLAFADNKPESQSEFQSRLDEDQANREQAIKVLESGQDQVRKPASGWNKFLSDGAASLLGGLL